MNNAGSVDLIAFLDGLLTNAPGTTVGPGRATELAMCDCDKLCASIYLDNFGDNIESRFSCYECRESFDFSFSLLGLIASLESNRHSLASGPDNDGVFTLANGCRFRLPTAGDRRRLAGLERDDAVAGLIRQCIVEGEPTEHSLTLQSAMDQVGPLLDLDLDASCPRCGMRQTVRFDIQSYLFRSLAYERQFLNYEVHCIAMAYGWGHQEILSLTREDRRTFARLIQSARPTRRRPEN